MSALESQSHRLQRSEVEALRKDAAFERERANEWLAQLFDMTAERDVLKKENVELKAELHSVDSALGNRSAFDDCKTRDEKVLKAIRTAAERDQLLAEVERLRKEVVKGESAQEYWPREFFALADERDALRSKLERAREALRQWDRLPMYDDIDEPRSYRVDRSELEPVMALTYSALSDASAALTETGEAEPIKYPSNAHQIPIKEGGFFCGDCGERIPDHASGCPGGDEPKDARIVACDALGSVLDFLNSKGIPLEIREKCVDAFWEYYDAELPPDQDAHRPIETHGADCAAWRIKGHACTCGAASPETPPPQKTFTAEEIERALKLGWQRDQEECCWFFNEPSFSRALGLKGGDK